jgi:hypothetical protein
MHSATVEPPLGRVIVQMRNIDQKVLDIVAIWPLLCASDENHNNNAMNADVYLN